MQAGVGGKHGGGGDGHGSRERDGLVVAVDRGNETAVVAAMDRGSVTGVAVVVDRGYVGGMWQVALLRAYFTCNDLGDGR